MNDSVKIRASRGKEIKVDENKSEKKAMENLPGETEQGFKHEASFGDGSMLPILASMCCCSSGLGKRTSRKHDFQEMLFALLKPCATADEAKDVISDMQEAVDSTRTVVDSMVW